MTTVLQMLKKVNCARLIHTKGIELQAYSNLIANRRHKWIVTSKCSDLFLLSVRHPTRLAQSKPDYCCMIIIRERAATRRMFTNWKSIIQPSNNNYPWKRMTNYQKYIKAAPVDITTEQLQYCSFNRTCHSRSLYHIFMDLTGIKMPSARLVI